MKKRSKRILTFYTEHQVCFDNIQTASFSKSPLKPYLLMQRMKMREGYYASPNYVTLD